MRWQLLSKLGGAPALHPLPLQLLLANARAPIAVACSGGPDSVAAAIIARELLPDAPLTLLHFNHHLRGAESDADEAAVRQLAIDLDADLRVGHWAEPSAKNETLAREARMNFLHEWEHAHIIFGHHADDAIETFLMRLARGANLQGLTAPHPISQIGALTHLRPLIRLRKAQITAALTSLEIPFRTDASNEGNDYLRNRIRNNLLPLWQSIETRDVSEGILRSLEQLVEMPQQISNSADTTLSTLHPLPIDGTPLHFPHTSITLSATLLPAPTAAGLKTESAPLHSVWIRPTASLAIRSWQPGERYTPFGAPGSRKIKELLNENLGHISPELRAVWPVIVDADGNALWIPGLRIAQEAALAPTDRHALKLNFSSALPKVQANDNKKSD